MTKTSKIIVAFFVLTIIITSVLAFSFSVNKPFTLDEVEEARMAQKINTMGPSTFHLIKDGGGGEPLSHPLLYSYTNAIFYKFFGSAEIALRGYGIVFFILSLWVLCYFVADVFKDNQYQRPAVFIAACIYSINPLLIQHSMLLNADNNISALFILFYVYLFYVFEKKPEKDFIKTRLILAVVVALNFLAKEITPVFMLFSVVVYRLLNREFKKFFIDLVCNIILGLAVFWIIWYLYCAFTNTDVLAFIKFTVIRKAPKVATFAFLLRQFRNFFLLMKWPIYWVSAPFFILVFLSIINRIGCYFKYRKLMPEDFILLSGVIMFVPFIFIKPSMDMMKYQYPTYAVFIVFIVWFCLKYLKTDLNNFVKSKKISVLFVLWIILCFWYFKLGDYVIGFWDKMSFKFMLFYYIPILLLVIVFFVMDKSKRKVTALSCACLFLICPINIGLNINQISEYTTAECWLNYGESGLKDTVDYLVTHADPEKVVFCRKDIAYYLNFRYEMGIKTKETTPIFKLRNTTRIKTALDLRNVQYFVFDRISSVVKARKDILDILGKYFFLEKKFGDFVILRRR